MTSESFVSNCIEKLKIIQESCKALESLIHSRLVRLKYIVVLNFYHILNMYLFCVIGLWYRKYTSNGKILVCSNYRLEY